MTVPVLLAVALPGGFITALIALAFCGLGSRHAANMAALLGTASVGLEFVMDQFNMEIWIKALFLLCLGGAALVLMLRRESALRTAPGAMLFCALRLIDSAVVGWIMASEPEWLRITVGIAWLVILVCGLFAVLAAFSGDVWNEAKSGLTSSEHILRLTISLGLINMAPFLAALPLEGLLQQLPDRAGGALIGIEFGLLCAAVLCCRLLLWAGQKDRRLLENYQTQQELDHFMTIIRSQRHDYNLHLHTIAGLLGKGSYEDCQKYIADVVADSQDVNVMMKIKEPVIGALISGYRDLAREQGCRLEISIDDDLASLISSPYDTNRVLGNLLQNALDEAMDSAVRDKRITLTTLRRGGNSVIRVSNAVHDPRTLEHLFDFGISGKSGHEGIGLNSVKRILERYHGMIYYEFEEDRVEFVVRIPTRV